MTTDKIHILAAGYRVWAELMIGCKHRAPIYLAQLILGSVIGIGASCITYWGDFVSLIIGGIALRQSFKVLMSDPKDYERSSCDNKKKYRTY